MTIQVKAANRLKAIRTTAGSWGTGPLETDGSADMHYELLSKVFTVCKKAEAQALRAKSDGNGYNIMPSWVGTLCGLITLNYPINKEAWVQKLNAIIASESDKEVKATFTKLRADVKSYKQTKHKFGFLDADTYND